MKSARFLPVFARKWSKMVKTGAKRKPGDGRRTEDRGRAKSAQKESPAGFPTRLRIQETVEPQRDRPGAGNPKFECRNPKQIQNTNPQNLKPALPAARFEPCRIQPFVLVSNFAIRASSLCAGAQKKAPSFRTGPGFKKQLSRQQKA